MYSIYVIKKAVRGTPLVEADAQHPMLKLNINLETSKLSPMKARD